MLQWQRRDWRSGRFCGSTHVDDWEKTGMRVATLVILLVAVGSARAESPPEDNGGRNSLELKFGGFRPDVDNSTKSDKTATPYASTFGGGSMLMFQIEVDRFLWRGFGSLGLGFTIGYAEKYGAAHFA